MLWIQHFRYSVQFIYIIFTLLSMSLFNEYKGKNTHSLVNSTCCCLLCSHLMKKGGRDLLSAQDASFGKKALQLGQ